MILIRTMHFVRCVFGADPVSSQVYWQHPFCLVEAFLDAPTKSYRYCIYLNHKPNEGRFTETYIL